MPRAKDLETPFRKRGPSLLRQHKQFQVFKSTSPRVGGFFRAFQTFYSVCGESGYRSFEYEIPSLIWGYAMGCSDREVGAIVDNDGRPVGVRTITDRKFLCTVLYIVRCLRFLKLGELLDVFVSLISMRPWRLRKQIERRTELKPVPLSLPLVDSLPAGPVAPVAKDGVVLIPDLLTAKLDFEELGKSDKLCYFCHFDPQSRLDPYVVHYLSALKEAGYETVFVSTSHAMPEGDLNLLKTVCAKAILRTNVGHDFVSWAIAVRLFPPQSRHAKVLFANDSVFGPVTDLRAVEVEAEKSGADLFGIHDSLEIHYHLQSNFLLCGARLAHSAAFRDFWFSVRVEFDKQKVIRNYELGISRFFLEHGFNLGALCPYDRLMPYFQVDWVNAEPLQQLTVRSFFAGNPSHIFWATAISVFGSPFLKKEFLLKNPIGLRNIYLWPRVVGEKSPKVQALIYDFLKRRSLENPL